MKHELVFMAILISLPTPALCAQVATAKTAIAIANRLCDSQWGNLERRNGRTWNVPADQWHARVDNKRWKVWTGDEAAPGLTVFVEKNGVPPKDCDLRFED